MMTVHLQTGPTAARCRSLYPLTEWQGRYSEDPAAVTCETCLALARADRTLAQPWRVADAAPSDDYAREAARRTEALKGDGKLALLEACKRIAELERSERNLSEQWNRAEERLTGALARATAAEASAKYWQGEAERRREIIFSNEAAAEAERARLREALRAARKELNDVLVTHGPHLSESWTDSLDRAVDAADAALRGEEKL